MARGKLEQIDEGEDGGPALWRYGTREPLADVMRRRYFAPFAGRSFRPGDIVLVVRLASGDRPTAHKALDTESIGASLIPEPGIHLIN